MKKILLSFFAFCVSLSSFAISLNGIEFTIDTLAMYPVGPGTTYYELRMVRADNGTNRLDCYLLEVDTRDPYVSVESVLGTGKLIGTETPSSMAKRSSTDTKIFFAGSNGDFFVTQGDVGRPISTTVVNNEFAFTPAGNGNERRTGGIDTDGKGVVGKFHSLSMKLVLADTILNISHANYYREANELVLYNRHNAATTGTNAYGTELQIQLLEGEKWQTTGKMKAKVTQKQENVGSMPLSAEYAVLSGHGTMQTELNKLNVGDEIILDFEIRLDDKVTNVSQLIGADNYEIIMQNGQIATSGFWNELHPRTGFGVSQTRDTVFFLVVDGRGVSRGCTTKVLAEMLKHYGAYHAVNWDGGGSSCIYVRPFDQMNNGSDGKERACANGMFAVANVPQVDNAVVKIAPYMPIYTLPRWGMAKPKFLGYNQYGVLVDTDVQDVVLSCDPALGEILPDGRFLLSGENGGKLIATWGDVTTELDVRIATSAPIAIRLDTVLCDATHPYKVEVEGTVGNNTVGLLADALTWTSADPTIATVNEAGEVLGVKNGTVVITGQLGDFVDQIVVNVEIPTANKMVWDDFRNPQTWTLSRASGLAMPELNVPADPAAPVNMKFTYKTARQPYLEMKKDSAFYSRPLKIQIPLTTDAVFSKINVTVRANNASQAQNIVFQNIAVGEKNILEINVAELFGTDVSIFPLHFEGVKLFLDTSTEKGERYITLPGIIEVFAEGGETAVENIVLGEDVHKFIENGILYIQSDNVKYNVIGNQIK